MALVSICFAPVVNAKDADEIGRSEGEKYSPFADTQTEFPGTVFEGLNIAVARRGITHKGRIDPGLHDSIQALEITQGGGTEDHAADHNPRR